ncbi:MAG: hypothetical protein V3S41_07815 [Spirochaetia bacterium]
MKRLVLRLALWAFPVLITFGQSFPWINYLNGNRFDRARQAVATVETDIDAWLTAKLERGEQLQTLYLSARRGSWSEEEYGSRLETAGFDPTADSDEARALSSIQAALEALGAVLRDQPPGAGSFSGREAVRWLGEVAAVLGVQVDEVADLVGLIQSQGQNATAAGAFVTSIDLPTPSGSAMHRCRIS